MTISKSAMQTLADLVELERAGFVQGEYETLVTAGYDAGTQDVTVAGTVTVEGHDHLKKEALE